MQNVSKQIFLILSLLFYFSVIQAQSSGSALNFNGFDEYIEVPHDASLNMTTAFTIAAWVNIDSYNEWASIVTKGVGDNNYAIHQSGIAGGSNEEGHLRFTGASTNLPAFPFLESNTQIPLNEWHYVAITYDGTNLQFYYDGQADGGGVLPGPLGTNNEPLTIGADFPEADEYWDGMLDEIRIWRVALSATHIQAAMNGHATPHANALAAYWRFDEGSGTIAYDKANNNDGFFNADPNWVSPGAPIGNSSRLANPEELSLNNYPNPFRDQTIIRFQLSRATPIQLKIYNSLGQPVKMMEDLEFEAGEHLLKWNGTDQTGKTVSTGVYFYQLIIGDEPSAIKKMVLQR